MILLFIVILLFAGYATLMLCYWRIWSSIPEFKSSNFEKKIAFSVIVPARNEEASIASLIQSLKEQAYPHELFEIIVIDDHSTDDTAGVVKRFDGVRLIQLEEDNINSYKKKAIEKGIASSKNEWIVCTDADCLPPKNWLEIIAAFKKEKNPVFIAAPVVFKNNNSLLEIFQALDFLVLQGITAVSVYRNLMSLCNGANLAYERKVFNAVNGFSGIDNIASGDDMLLMHKIRKEYPDSVYYIKSKSAIVTTEPQKTWKSFFHQRIRWASKAGHYNDKRILPVLLLVYIFNLSFLVLLIAGFWNYHYWIYAACFWVLKTIIEFPFVHSVSSFFGKRSLIKYFFFLQPLHIFYTILAGLFGQFGKYEWKGRKVK
ncbi:MAG: glycosyltransferase [Chitinophagaceae bacterium]|nr:glycosyltransferase [Chitinophagaceae bacterium]